MDLRAGARLWGPLVVGLDLGVGGGSTRGARFVVDGLAVPPDGALVLGATGSVGVQVPVGPVRVQAEAVLGARMLAFQFATAHGACESSSSVLQVLPVVAPRVSVEWWATPWVTLGASFSADLLREGTYTGSVFVQAHARTWGGQAPQGR